MMMEEYCDAEQLIELVKMRPALYDHTLREHSNKAVIDELWNEIAAIMNCPVADCRSKWANLRCAYGRHLRQERGLPFSIRNRRRKTWYMAGAMAFLENHMAQNRLMNKKKLYADNFNNYSVSGYFPQSNYYQKLESSGNLSYEGANYAKQEPAIHITEDECSINYTANECSSSIGASSPSQTSQLASDSKFEDVSGSSPRPVMLPMKSQSPQLPQLASGTRYEVGPPSSPKALTRSQPPQTPQLASGNRFEAVCSSTAKSSTLPSKSPQTPPELVSGSRFEVACDREQPQDSDSMFFKSMLADYKQLSKKSKRHFREQMVITLNKLQEEEEQEELRSHVKLEYV